MDKENYIDEFSSSLIQGDLFPDLSYNLPLRHAKIMCTINQDFTISKIEDMIEAGMEIARIDFSHDDQNTYKKIIDNVRAATRNLCAKTNFPAHIAIAVDTKGPQIQTGVLADGLDAQIFLAGGTVIRLTTDEKYKFKGNSQILYVDYEDLTNVVDPGLRLYIDNCSLMLVVDRVEEACLICTIVDGGWMGSYKDVKGQGIFRKKLDFSPKDISDLEFAISEQVNCIMNSYTMAPESIIKIKHMLIDNNAIGDILVIAKIENKFGARKLSEILDVADGIAVSRAHMSVEFPSESVFFHHKSLVDVCHLLGKPFISLDRVLLSMAESPLPDFAGMCDLGNLILEGVDCVMLSNGMSQYPLETLKFTEKMCREAEVCHRTTTEFHPNPSYKSIVETRMAVAQIAVQTAKYCKANAIITVTVSGKMEKVMSKLRPQCPIISVCNNPKFINDIKFYRSLNPILYEQPIGNDWEEHLARCLKFGMQYGKHLGIIARDDLIVVVTSWRQTSGILNTIQVEHCD